MASAEAAPATAAPVVVETGSGPVATAAAGVVTNLLTGLIIVAVIVAAAYVLLPSFGKLFCKIPLIGPAMCPGGCRTAAHPRGEQDPSGICYECPPGMTRTADPVTAPTACRAISTGYCEALPHPSGYDKAKPDPDGRCYSCPDGLGRNTTKVTSSNACSANAPGGIAGGSDAYCKKVGGSGAFPDPDSFCYSCPDGMGRNVTKVSSDTACTAAGNFGGMGTYPYCKKVGGEGSFPDGNGKCYKCPVGWIRTADSVTGKHACSAGVGVLSKGAIDACRDVHGFPDPDGYCWKCPSGWNRTIFKVTGKAACIKRGTIADYGSAERVGEWTKPAEDVGSWVGPATKHGSWATPAKTTGHWLQPAATYAPAQTG